MNRLVLSLILGALVVAGLAGSTAWAPQGAALSASAGFDVVYKIPVPGMVDGVVFVRAIRNSVAPVDRRLGSFTTATVVAAATSTSSGKEELITLIDKRGQSWRVDVGSAALALAPVPDALATAAIGDDGRVYEQRGRAVVALSPDGGVLSSFALPLPKPGTPILDGHPTTAILPPDTGRLGAIVVSHGHVFAFVDNSVNAVVADLTTRRRADLVGTGWVTAAAMASDGFLYAAIADPSRRQNSYRLVRFDPGTLRLLKEWPTPIRFSNGAIDEHVQLVPSPQAEVWVFASQQGPGSDHTGHLLRLDAASQTLTELTSTPNIGSRIEMGPTAGHTYSVVQPVVRSIASMTLG